MAPIIAAPRLREGRGLEIGWTREGAGPQPCRVVPGFNRQVVFRIAVGVSVLSGLGDEGRWRLVQPEPERPILLTGLRSGPVFLLSFLPETDRWVAVETSVDGVTWNELVNVAATIPVTSYADVEAGTISHRMYRLRAPGSDAGEAEAFWKTHAPRGYRYRLHRLRMTWPAALSATVEVRDGVKIVSGIEADGEPWPEAPTEWFPTVEDLFEEIDRAREERVPQVWVTYDPERRFPWRCTFDRREGGFSGEDDGTLVQYRISDLVVLEEPRMPGDVGAD